MKVTNKRCPRCNGGWIMKVVDLDGGTEYKCMACSHVVAHAATDHFETYGLDGKKFAARDAALTKALAASPGVSRETSTLQKNPIAAVPASREGQSRPLFAHSDAERAAFRQRHGLTDVPASPATIPGTPAPLYQRDAAAARQLYHRALRDEERALARLVDAQETVARCRRFRTDLEVQYDKTMLREME